MATVKGKPVVMTVWVGFLDGKPCIGRDTRYESSRHLDVYPSRRAAARAYSDVRKATLRIRGVADADRR